MAKKMTFEEWTGGATEAEIREMKKVITKRFWMYFFISLIPVVNFITMGCAIFCYNNLSMLKTRGRNSGSNLFRLILMLYAWLIPPIIVVQVCAHSNSLGTKVLGLTEK